MPPNIWDTHGLSGNVFADPVVSSTTPCPQELNPWSSSISEPVQSSTAEKNENQTPVQDQRCQSRPSNSFIPSEGDSPKYDGAVQTNHDCRFQNFISTHSLHKPRLLAGRTGSRPRYVLVHNFLRRQCNGSGKWSWLIHWMN